MIENVKICVVGLGYVGLPLLVALSRHFTVMGLDNDAVKLRALKSGSDVTGELSADELMLIKNIDLVDNLKGISDVNFFIVTVPTPITLDNKPDLNPLISATTEIAENMCSGCTIVYESTVYPGVTEEICQPIIEEITNLKLNSGFWLGYSPERINPSDKLHKISDIVKVISGSDQTALELIKGVYSKIISAGLHIAPSIKVAEASKVIENAQRDVNIAFMNELTMIFERLNISIFDVLDAAKTKWNFLDFYPGLVGGHCISVDPYYLTYKSKESGFIPDMLLSARHVNESMADFLVNVLINQFIDKEINIKKSRIAILGLTFKENCPDVRNSKSVEVYQKLEKFGGHIDLIDPYIDKLGPENVYSSIPSSNYDAIVLLVNHDEFSKHTLEYFESALNKPNGFILDLKNKFMKNRLLLN